MCVGFLFFVFLSFLLFSKSGNPTKSTKKESVLSVVSKLVPFKLVFFVFFQFSSLFILLFQIYILDLDQRAKTQDTYFLKLESYYVRNITLNLFMIQEKRFNFFHKICVLHVLLFRCHFIYTGYIHRFIFIQKYFHTMSIVI